ncbi:MAG: Type II restriction enzyme DdeI [candidate division Zixibacteria bacterium RBG-1]|nr:MAG: Type II restriction enzyme DdeI [candidate division Zixibacteria bacterium RBG-1]OGC84000.1 MAG: restriction endonuclease [candidate division Zixibacteria bacterium RBG_19FT_COMBO_42_43]
MDKTISKDIESLINAYEFLVKGIDTKAKESEDRAYGGVIRAGKGLLVESIAKSLVEIAWKELGRDLSKLSLEKKVIKIPIKEEYIERVKSPEVKKFIKDHIKDFYYPLRTDVHIHVDGKLKIAMECKAYTENAMLKRILVDFTLFKQVYPNLSFVLFQLESQLGGDYSLSNDTKHGSPSTHTLLSYFDIDLNIITLLEGERKVDKPIHKAEYYKSLRAQSLLAALEVFKNLLK